MINYELQDIVVYILVFLRMAGMLFMNPILSRKNIPAKFRIALVLCLTILIAPTLDTTLMKIDSDIILIAAMFYELIIGILFNYVSQVFYFMLFFAGDILDFQFGLSMAKVFDPGTNIQMSVSGNILNILFVLYFFVTNCHLQLIRIMASSFNLLPVGAMHISSNVAGFGIDLFVSVFSLIIKLVLPFVAMEFVVEISMGILMKLIPQIHVFVINIQFKLLLAFSLLLIFAQPMSEYIDKYISALFQSLEKILIVMSG
ncbi:MAG: flagellar biosynthetic protein FliR [Oscillospiraceae bacterium]